MNSSLPQNSASSQEMHVTPPLSCAVDGVWQWVENETRSCEAFPLAWELRLTREPDLVASQAHTDYLNRGRHWRRLDNQHMHSLLGPPSVTLSLGWGLLSPLGVRWIDSATRRCQNWRLWLKTPTSRNVHEYDLLLGTISPPLVLYQSCSTERDMCRCRTKKSLDNTRTNVLSSDEYRSLQQLRNIASQAHSDLQNKITECAPLELMRLTTWLEDGLAETSRYPNLLLLVEMARFGP